jgi:hypothetical protein
MEKITAKEGMWLTQSGDINDEERVFTDSVYLAVNDSKERWRDATQAEKDAWDARMESIIEEEEMNYEQEG